MKDIVLTEQVRCPWCKRQFTGIIRWTDTAKPYIICVNSHCEKLIIGENLQATVGEQGNSFFGKLAAGTWPQH